MGISLLTVNSRQLVFNWIPIQSNCSSLQYGTESDCGSCSDESQTVLNQTSKTCIVEQPNMDERVCSFAVNSVICRNISGSFSTPVNVTLKGRTLISIICSFIFYIINFVDSTMAYPIAIAVKLT